MFEFLGDVWEGAWDTSVFLGILVLILYAGLVFIAIGIALAAIAIALTIVAIFLFILGLILFGSLVYGSVEGLVRGFIHYFSALHNSIKYGGYLF